MSISTQEAVVSTELDGSPIGTLLDKKMEQMEQRERPTYPALKCELPILPACSPGESQQKARRGKSKLNGKKNSTKGRRYWSRFREL